MGVHIRGSELDFEKSQRSSSCYLTTCRWFVTAKPIFSNVLLLLKRWKMIERRRERKNCEICKFFIETRDSDFDLEDFHVDERDKWESNLVILIRKERYIVYIIYEEKWTTWHSFLFLLNRNSSRCFPSPIIH